MRDRYRFAVVFVLLLLTAASAYLFFSPTPVIILSGSAWLPGFLIALTSAVFGTLLLPYRGRSVWYKIVIGASWGILLLYLLMLTPFAVLLLGP